MIHYLKGDATYPQGKGTKFIVHICNDIGAWGAGFVMALSKRWKEPEEDYKAWMWISGDGECALGDIQTVHVAEDLFVINMVAQHGIGADKNNRPPIRYHALRRCLESVANIAKSFEATIHMPRIGCGLAGGTWDKIEPLIAETMHDLEVYVYDL